ncbi:hypothetical protein LCGC14_2795490 [marine sediment metagenome]|uniref:Uncharacterized protein n=1 Tax=marine sediment metagenome TaxID=412755 RepID=A0A0F9AXX1_9ZZZZ
MGGAARRHSIVRDMGKASSLQTHIAYRARARTAYQCVLMIFTHLVNQSESALSDLRRPNMTRTTVPAFVRTAHETVYRYASCVSDGQGDGPSLFEDRTQSWERCRF